MNKYTICKFCGKEKKLIKAHIIPRNFYLARKNDKLISIYVQIELKEETTKTVRYIDFDNINIGKYVEWNTKVW